LIKPSEFTRPSEAEKKPSFSQFFPLDTT